MKINAAKPLYKKYRFGNFSRNLDRFFIKMNFSSLPQDWKGPIGGPRYDVLVKHRMKINNYQALFTGPIFLLMAGYIIPSNPSNVIGMVCLLGGLAASFAIFFGQKADLEDFKKETTIELENLKDRIKILENR